MGLSKYKLGQLIERSTVNNKDQKYGIDLIAGVNNDGVFTTPKGNPLDVDLKPYKLVNNGAFVYNPTRIDLGSLAYRTEGFCIVSHLYIIFYLNEKGKELVDPYYLYMYFHRDEFCREVRFRNFGSQRPEFSFSDMADISITLPSIEQQRKYVDVYLALQNNLAAYQSKVEELKLVCDGYIEELRRKMKCEKIGTYIRECNERNETLSISEVQGVESSGNFSETRANTIGLDFHNYKIVKPNQFAYNPSRINLGSIAMREKTECIVSPMYIVFEVADCDKLMPDYLILWLTRSEFFRSTLFYASGSVRDTFGFSEMKEVSIPIPDISVQREIVNIHKCYIERQRIATQLKEQLNSLCPILIKGSLENN